MSKSGFRRSHSDLSPSTPIPKPKEVKQKAPTKPSPQKIKTPKVPPHTEVVVNPTLKDPKALSLDTPVGKQAIAAAKLLVPSEPSTEPKSEDVSKIPETLVDPAMLTKWSEDQEASAVQAELAEVWDTTPDISDADLIIPFVRKEDIPYISDVSISPVQHAQQQEFFRSASRSASGSSKTTDDEQGIPDPAKTGARPKRPAEKPTPEAQISINMSLQLDKTVNRKDKERIHQALIECTPLYSPVLDKRQAQVLQNRVDTELSFWNNDVRQNLKLRINERNRGWSYWDGFIQGVKEQHSTASSEVLKLAISEIRKRGDELRGVLDTCEALKTSLSAAAGGFKRDVEHISGKLHKTVSKAEETVEHAKNLLPRSSRPTAGLIPQARPKRELSSVDMPKPRTLESPKRSEAPTLAVKLSKAEMETKAMSYSQNTILHAAATKGITPAIMSRWLKKVSKAAVRVIVLLYDTYSKEVAEAYIREWYGDVLKK